MSDLSIKSDRTARPSQPAVSPRTRLLYIDNIRWTMIILVISMHAADTYSPFGNWYFVDRRPISLATTLAFGVWQMYLQAFFMGLLFFIAGYFVPGSFERKGALGFLRDRAIRLGIPVLLYMFVIGPVTEYYFAHSWTSTLPTSFTNEWVKHIRNGQFMQENGPLWFCLALLIFLAGYALFRSVWRSETPAVLKQEAPTTLGLICFALLMAVFSFFVRAGRPPSILNMHLGDFPQYVLLFCAGTHVGRYGWLSRLSFKKGMVWLATVLPVGMIAWFGIVVSTQQQNRGAALSGGWHWQSAAFCIWESSACVAVSFALIVLFREMFNSQGRLARFLSENAFSVYVFHPPVVILMARLMQGMHWHPLLQFCLLTLISAVLSFVLSAVVFRKIPFLRQVL
jgi:fucose 4-O-acetylase-like acetyltransferase